MAHQAQVQFYRGAAAGLPSLADGEPGFTTDSHTLYVGMGGTNYAVGPGSSSLAIGDAISGGANNRVLYEDGSGNLAVHADLTFVPGSGLVATDGTRTASLADGTQGLHLVDGVNTVDLCNVTRAARFTDGTRTVDLCDGSHHITYTPATSLNWTGTPPSDIWDAIDRLAAACVALGQTP